jgi:hypothetical protein
MHDVYTQASIYVTRKCQDTTMDHLCPDPWITSGHRQRERESEANRSGEGLGLCKLACFRHAALEKSKKVRRRLPSHLLADEKLRSLSRNQKDGLLMAAHFSADDMVQIQPIVRG